MADTASDPTADRCKLNATLSSSVHDKTELLSFYQQWSDKYDEDFRPEHYVGPRLAVEAVCELIPNEKRSQVTVLDVAAGTGLVGLELAKNGFNSIDAIDGSEDMLTKLRQKGIYKRATQAMLGNADNESLPKDEYDVVTSCGGFVPGHLPCQAVHDLVRMCKPGGLIVIVMRYEYLTTCEELRPLEPLMDELEAKNPSRWSRLKRHISPNYLLDKEGIVFAYRKSL
ncbi:methyltransferase-like protein 27 [Daphnia pulex]|uniref:Methyltransferase domain-containing protein n=1 Tax=Daphnia pulex TaxID=6669 RepID=E9GEQ6_DAPPU|nr:methyltransferase-like protein 27 [Daphnia pulex]EFX82038.1 hypothetical protein DAPPUDRAFT_317034 [Daphnia pulex]|eukprot:EFX82038.1 hypothetical protein DAPPUDRAFT_317034 [Daphnia pulex]